MDLEELKARAILLLALAGAGLAGYFWLSMVPGTAAEIRERGPQADAAGWRNIFLAPSKSRFRVGPAPQPLPSAPGETIAGVFGAIVAVLTIGTIYLVWRDPLTALLACSGCVYGPPFGELAIRALTHYPSSGWPGIGCGLGVVLGLVLMPALIALAIEEFRKLLGFAGS